MGHSVKSRKAGIFTPAGAGYTDSLWNLVDSEWNWGGGRDTRHKPFPRLK